ncbi:MAG: FecR family protein, partial [Methyloceanibacter sp.]
MAVASLARILALLLAMAAAEAAIAAGPASIGLVDKVENEAKIVTGDKVATAIAGTPVQMKDELRTGPEGRLQIIFRDNTVLTLGEKASIVIDRYVYDPDGNVGETILQATKGAFRFASGHIKELTDSKIAVSTPVADIGVRGTEFWGGALDGKYGVLLLEGEVVVSNQAGSVTLSAEGQGTDIPSPFDPPGPVRAWSPQKIARAVATVTLH